MLNRLKLMTLPFRVKPEWGLSLSKNYKNALVSGIIEETGVLYMEQWRKDGRAEVVMVDMEALVPKEHLLRKIEKVMDYEWLYERLSPYYCHDNGRPGTDPVVLIKMVLIQHLFGIPSLRLSKNPCFRLLKAWVL